MKTVKYKGYTGTMSYCTEDNIYYGELVGIEDSVSYHSEEGVVELQNAFIDAVDDYIDILDCTYRTGLQPYEGGVL